MKRVNYSFQHIDNDEEKKKRSNCHNIYFTLLLVKISLKAINICLNGSSKVVSVFALLHLPTVTLRGIFLQFGYIEQRKKNRNRIIMGTENNRAILIKCNDKLISCFFFAAF